MDYKKKLYNLIDLFTYRKLFRHLKSLFVVRPMIEDETKKFLRKSKALTPRHYRSPKVHKPGTTLRFIVSAGTSSTYDTVKHICKLFQPHVNLDIFVSLFLYGKLRSFKSELFRRHPSIV